MIDDGLFQSIQRRTDMALEQGADYLFYEIGTYGGLVEAADNISKYLIFEAAERAHTVAYITTEAISAGAMISVSCQDIIMKRNTTIGDCAPITMGESLEGVEREKAESFIRAAFDRAASANNYPQAVLRAMVTVQVEVYKVYNQNTGAYEFFETADLPTDANVYNLSEKERVISDDRLLTVHADKALEYGIARAVVKDLEGALEVLEGRDNIHFSRPVQRLHTNWSEEMVRKINHPAVIGVLVAIALLGLYIELSTPGLGLPGLAAVICFVIIVGSKYLIGLANWIEVALFILGFILLIVEIFVIPGFGIAGVAGIVCMMAGIFGMLVRNPPDRLPWPQNAWDWTLFANNILGLLLGLAGFFILAWVLNRYLPRMKLFSGLILTPAASKAATAAASTVGMEASHTTDQGQLQAGDIGEVESPLHPAGKVRFGRVLADCVALAEFIDKGTRVSIQEVHGNRIVVKPFIDEHQGNNP
jgi:membrane-bound serine protease (ClpP class)